VIPIYELFKAEVDKQHLNNKDLAKMTHFSESMIKAFMCGTRNSDTVANALARVLDIEI